MGSQDASEDRWKTWLGNARASSYKAVHSDLDLVQLATWNQKLASSLFGDIAHVEVAFRNSLSTYLQHWSIEKGYEGQWHDSENAELSVLGGEQLRVVLDRTKHELKRIKGVVRSDDLVAELSLGFWLKFLDRRYQAIHPGLISALTGLSSRNIRPLPKLGAEIRTLRNRIAHCHRILHRDLNRDWQLVCQLAKFVDPELEAFLVENSTTPGLILEFSQIAEAEF